MSNTIWGLLKSIERAPEENGQIVLRAIIDFYDGNSPDLTFKTIWDRIPVTIVEKAAEAGLGPYTEAPENKRLLERLRGQKKAAEV